MDEGLVDKYLDQLQTIGTDRVLILTNMYAELLETQPDKSIQIMFRKLVKLYGVKRVFKSILDVYDIEPENPKKAYGLFVYVLKKNVLRENKVHDDVDLTGIVDRVQKQRVKQLRDLKTKGNTNG